MGWKDLVDNNGGTAGMGVVLLDTHPGGTHSASSGVRIPLSVQRPPSSVQ
jgi:hypothetical protein